MGRLTILHLYNLLLFLGEFVVLDERCVDLLSAQDLGRTYIQRSHVIDDDCTS
jgi:hypothetical protein